MYVSTDRLSDEMLARFPGDVICVSIRDFCNGHWLIVDKETRGIITDFPDPFNAARYMNQRAA